MTAAARLPAEPNDALAPALPTRLTPRAETTPEVPSVATDPHAPKLSPDDPRLRLRRPASRTLRTGPIVVLCILLFGAIMAAVAMAFQTPAGRTGSRPEASGTPPAPVVPETIRNASASPRSGAARAEPAPARAQGAARTAETDERRLQRDQDLKAQHSGILFEGEGPPPESPGARSAESPRPSSLLPTAPAPSGSPSGGETDPNGQDRKNAFLDGLGAKGSDHLAATLAHPKSPYELLAGTIIPAVLITAINSDLPGPVIAQVRENVYDTVSGNFLLVPQGARLLAQYDSKVAWGQERVLLCWNRLLLPNGDSLNLQCMPAADLQGGAGLTDSVDEHWWRLLKGAAIASLLAATTTAVGGNTDTYQPTFQQTWARNGAGEMNQVGQQITRRDLMIQPTITVRPGYSVNVIVTKDIDLPPYPGAADTARGAR